MSNPAGRGSVTAEKLGRLLDEHGAALELFAAQWSDAPDDCVQEAFIELARQQVEPDNVAAWLYRVVRNRAISRCRAGQRRRHHEAVAASLAPTWSSPTNEPLVDTNQLAMAIQALDEDLREVVIARVWGNLTFEQIAEAFAISTSTAHRRYETGLWMLRQLLTVEAARKG